MSRWLSYSGVPVLFSYTWMEESLLSLCIGEGGQVGMFEDDDDSDANADDGGGAGSFSTIDRWMNNGSLH